MQIKSYQKRIMTFGLMALAIVFALSFSAAAVQGGSAQAPQNDSIDALAIALDYLDQNKADMGLSTADVANPIVSDMYVSQETGVTHVYLQQQVNGIAIYNAIVNVNVLPNGDVLNAGNRFVINAARTANGAVPSLAVEDAVGAAANHFGLGDVENVDVLESFSGVEQRMVLSNAGISLEAIPAKLMYTVAANGSLRLTWDLTISELSTVNWWSVRIDANNGAVVSQNNYIVHENQHDVPGGDGVAGFSAVDGGGQSPVQGISRGTSFADGSSYNVVAIPLEAPSFGARTIENEPSDDTVSPFGWHDTDGVAGAEDTHTIGNNVHAALDVDANNTPDAGSEPDGGAGLDFSFPFDDVAQNPDQYQPAIVTNLFYWNNVIHDVTALHGFDEASGNFQETNYSGMGSGSDFVWADAQDGSGTNNANFGTPPDGSNPRMQMFIWTNPFGELLTVTAPAAIAGDYLANPSNNGGVFGGSGGDITIVEDGTAPTADACEAVTNDLTGKIALIVWNQGQCNSSVFVQNAADAGAIGAIIVDNTATPLTSFGGSASIPSVGIGDADGQAIINEIVNNAETVSVTIDQNPAGQINRDSDFDNGIITHEYGHGVSNRLTGGPSNTSCLGNAEQMGEGWSDLLALMLTATAAQTSTQGRGVGTYVTFEDPTTGLGIRAYPYSTDMSVDPRTFADVPATSTSGSPHAHGSIWTAIVWEVYWNLVNDHGFNADIYGDWTTGGNNLALRLMLDGMKLQPCSPGFVDGRDGIIAADLALTNGVNECSIWQGFAKRGLGYSADQGVSTDRTDGTAAFDLPPQCTELTITPPAQSVCAGDSADYMVGVLAGFVSGPVDMSVVSGMPAVTTAAFSPNPVASVPSTTTLTLATDATTPGGNYPIIIQGANGTMTSTNTLQLQVLTAAPGATALQAPVDGATAQPLMPTLSWSVDANASSYTVEVDDAADFATPIYSATVTDATHTMTMGLNTATTYYWRVISNNACGVGAASAAFSFITLQPFACAAGEVEIDVYSTDFESGAADWTHSATVQDTWALTTTAASGVNAFHAEDQALTNDQYLVSPMISLPAASVGLEFQNMQAFEAANDDGRCWDAGILEISTDGGTTWEYIDNSHMLTDPYDDVIWNDSANNPIAADYGAVNAWCDSGQPWTPSSVDLTDWADNDVNLRWRLGNDNAAGAPGWWIDDVSISACSAPDIDVAPASIEDTVAPNAMVDHTLTISNVGTSDLNWEISELNALIPPSAVDIDVSALDIDGLQASAIAVETSNAPARGGSLLYDQTATQTTSGTTSQFFGDFGGGSEAGDDFVVPNDVDGWNITAVRAPGFYTDARSATAVNVRFFAENGGIPSEAALYEFQNVMDFTDSAGDIMVTLPEVVILAPGTYWVEVQPVMDFNPGGVQWFWFTNSDQIGSERAFRDLGDLFGTGCTTWTTAPDCLGAGNPDLAYQLFGEVSVACDFPSDIPWLSVTPISGTTAAGMASDVTVSLDATGLTEGVYNGHLCVLSNDSDERIVSVPVTLTIEANPTDISFSGFSGKQNVSTIVWLVSAFAIALGGAYVLRRRQDA